MRCIRPFILWLSLIASGCAQVVVPAAEDPSDPVLPISPERKTPDESSTPAPLLDTATLVTRIEAAIALTIPLAVDASDPLGEGPGHFDPDPRRPENRIDCMTWLQWVLALAYAEPETDPQPWMDALRYYGGVIGFDTRKHYVDRWLWMDGGPIEPVACPEALCEEEWVQLELGGLPASRGFPCSIWRPEVRETRIQTTSPENLEELIATLEPGFYVLFGLASPHYLGLYGEHSGPMAQVHPALLHKGAQTTRITHASTALERVAEVDLSEWLDATKRLHRGSVLYQLNPEWDPSSAVLQVTPESRCQLTR
jgi:hypothetical protein